MNLDNDSVEHMNTETLVAAGTEPECSSRPTASLSNARLLVVNDFEVEGGAENIARMTAEVLSEDLEVETHWGSPRWELPRSALSYVYSRNQYRRLLEKLQSFRPQFVHLHNFYHCLTPSILHALGRYRASSKEFQPRFVFTAHDYHLVCPHSGYCHFRGGEFNNFPIESSLGSMLMRRLDVRGPVYSLLKKTQWLYNYRLLRSQRVIDRILAPSRFLGEVYANRFGQDKVRLVRYPMDTEGLGMARRERAERGTRTRMKLLFLGRVDPEKGVRELIDAVGGLPADDFELTVIGDGKQLQELREHVRSHGLGEQVQLTGRIAADQVKSQLPGFDALVVPSLWYENSPLVIIEAALAGLRLVLSGWGGLKELGQMCADVDYFDPHDPASLSRGLQQCRKRWLAGETSTRDYDQLVEEFSLAKFRRQTLELYAELLPPGEGE